MLQKPLLLLTIGLATVYSPPSAADPLHAIADGAYWHHDSGWIFPERIAAFERVGVPQDVAGSRDAVAYYARMLLGRRVVVSVNLFPADSARAEVLEQGCDDGTVPLHLTRKQEWRVRLCVNVPAGTSPSELEEFVRAQRWDTLPG